MVTSFSHIRKFRPSVRGRMRDSTDSRSRFVPLGHAASWLSGSKNLACLLLFF